MGNAVREPEHSERLLEGLALSIGVASWETSGVTAMIAETFAKLGCQVQNFHPDEALPSALDAVFIFGPDGSIVPLVDRLLAVPTGERPILAFQHAEQLPNPKLPEALVQPVSQLRSGIERALVRRQQMSDAPWVSTLKKMVSPGTRFRYCGDLRWLHKTGLSYVLAIASVWRADILRRQGFHVIATPAFGFPNQPEWGADLALERDIPVLWIGKAGSKRRARLLAQVRNELQVRNVELMVIDGVENPYVFGEERTALLNRTKVVLNLLRAPWDENAGRYYLAALNRAMIVTEPTLPHHPPFVAGVHLVESPIEKIADSICYYLSHEEERMKIADQAFGLVTTDMAIDRTVESIIDTIVQLKNISN
ncbi:MAG: glycosyltransferase [Chloroflexota bacterium]